MCLAEKIEIRIRVALGRGENCFFNHLFRGQLFVFEFFRNLEIRALSVLVAQR
jgi:hypothetical protein